MDIWHRIAIYLFILFATALSNRLPAEMVPSMTISPPKPAHPTTLAIHSPVKSHQTETIYSTKQLQLVSQLQPLKKNDLMHEKELSHMQMWNLQKADIRAVIKTIAKLIGRNFIIDPSLKGKITMISSKPMLVSEIYPVFLSMLQALNYAAIPFGNIIKIVPIYDVKSYTGNLYQQNTNLNYIGGMSVRMISLNNISATELATTLQPLMPKSGNISTHAASNTIILSGETQNIHALVDMIHVMDNKSETKTQTIHLKYANAKQLVRALYTLQNAERSNGRKTRLSYATDAESNAILINGPPEQLYKVTTFIHSMDIMNKQEHIETAVIHLNYLKAKDLVPILSKVANTNIKKNQPSYATRNVNQKSQIAIQAEKSRNAVIIRAPVLILNHLKTIIKKLDIRPKEVLVQAIIVRIDDSVLRQLGIQWGTTTPGIKSPTTVSNFPAGIGFIPSGDLRVLIEALETHTSTDVLATPSVVVLNNTSATISDGKNVGILNRQYEGTGSVVSNHSALPFNTFERKDVTLLLKVTPQITPNNTINLEIEQQNDSLDPDARSRPDNPTIDTTKIKTNVLVNSGDILVLGGLISNDHKFSENKIPFLGDIPILGYLFRYKRRSFEKKNLMIFIRPIILHNNRETHAQTMKHYHYIRTQELQKKMDLNTGDPGLPVLPNFKDTQWITLPPPF